jgi:hypothetical protein
MGHSKLDSTPIPQSSKDPHNRLAPLAHIAGPMDMDKGQINSSDRFITIQTLSMDASCNRVQDRIHDFFPQQLPRVEINPPRR